MPKIFTIRSGKISMLTQLASQKINKNTMGQKPPARMRKSLIGSPKKSFLTRSSNTVNITFDISRYNVHFTSPANVQPTKKQHVSLEKQASFLQDILDISPLDFPQFTASTPQVVIFNQTFKEIQNELVITMLSLNKPC